MSLRFHPIAHQRRVRCQVVPPGPVTLRLVSTQTVSNSPCLLQCQQSIIPPECLDILNLEERRNQKATDEAFTEDGFFRTADVGELAPDGTLAIRGRLKELIISGGFNVYPREVELVLEEHPAVEEVAVAGVPSEDWGEEVTAYVVPSKSTPLDEHELIAFARERLATYKCPRRVVVLEKLPRNAMGKVEKSKLSAR